MIKCPCEECICLAVCRNKFYLNLVEDCELISSYLRRPCTASRERNYPLIILHKLFKPKTWYLNSLPKDKGVLLVYW